MFLVFSDYRTSQIEEGRKIYQGGEVVHFIKKNDVLAVLSIRDNSIATVGTRELSLALKEFNLLQTLDLSDNLIGDEGAEAMASFLKENNSMTTLDISRNSISQVGAKALSNALKKNTKLIILDLAINQVDGEEMATALRFNVTLKTLNLAGNAIGIDGALAIVKTLKTENRSLTTLDLSGHAFLRIDNGDIIKEMVQALKDNHSLDTLKIECNGVDTEQASFLALALKERTNCLTTLALGMNDIEVEGIGAIAESLKINETLTSLDLTGNEIGYLGANLLADALIENKFLKTLNLFYNRLGCRGTEELARALKENKSLMYLDLGHNGIGVLGAKALGDALCHNKSLIELQLHSNQLGDEGAKSIARALKENNTLSTLSLCRNDIFLSARQIGGALKENTALTRLGLAGNKFGPYEVFCIVEGVARNGTLKSLNLATNDIASDIRRIIDCLKENFSLVEFDFSPSVPLKNDHLGRMQNLFQKKENPKIEVENLIQRNQINIVRWYYQKEITMPILYHLLKCHSCLLQQRKRKISLLYHLLVEYKDIVQRNYTTKLLLPNIGIENDVNVMLMKTTEKLKLKYISAIINSFLDWHRTIQKRSSFAKAFSVDAIYVEEVLLQKIASLITTDFLFLRICPFIPKDTCVLNALYD
eukprot:Awhi_evm1s13969